VPEGTPASAFARRREATCNAILDATGQLIAEKGVDGFTISEVAQRGGINRALIYHYFKNRDNLVVQAIQHILARYDAVRPPLGPEAMEQTARMYIEHPEIGRFFFQMLLTNRSLGALDQRMVQAIEHLERLRREQAPASSFDPTFAIVIIVLVQLSWSFARDELARLLGIPTAEADRRFIAQLRRATEIGLRALAADGTPTSPK
jgi:AcrR family transcriptional regulator